MSKTAFLFPGQGAQTVGMGAELADTLPQARALFDSASDILGYDLLQICKEGPTDKLNSTVYSQPALFVCSLAAAAQLQHDAPQRVRSCAATAGLSLGEYTALVFAGAIDFQSGLRLVHERGRAMQDASDNSAGSMLSILGLEREEIERLCDQARGACVLELANLLCPGNIVVSGHVDACDRMEKLAQEAGAMRVVPLSVAGAFHTSLMQPAVARLASVLTDIEIRKPRIPVVFNVDALPHEDPDEIRKLLIQQVVQPVMWEDSMRWLIDQFGIEQIYEIGPGRVLRGLMKRISRKLPCENIAA